MQYVLLALALLLLAVGAALVLPAAGLIVAGLGVGALALLMDDGKPSP